MSVFLYNILCTLYLGAIHLVSLFNDKAKKWVEGRKGLELQLATISKNGDKYIWMHCSSLGEFEQGRPLVEKLKESYPGQKVLLTFFSPSGYEIQKNYALADHVLYLPMDSKQHAKKFIKAINPSLVIFVKYEFWYHYLHQLKVRGIPTLLVSAAFRENQAFFKWYGGFFREMLGCFNYMFVQDATSLSLLATMGITKNVIVSGDTRYDRVATIAQKAKKIDAVEQFKEGYNLLIAGSTWPGDEKLLHASFQHLPQNWKLVIAPHEVHHAHILEISNLFGDGVVTYSALSKNEKLASARVLVIDNIGMLSSLYTYGSIAYVGGGFQKGGIHNILEPAVFGLPVIFGPNYKKFVEAKNLVEHGFAFPVEDEKGLIEKLEKLISNASYRETIHTRLTQFMQQNIGASGLVVDKVVGEGWLG